MERRLIVMRHAKSSWDHPGLSDHRRPLNPRGQRDAPRVAARLQELGWTPEVVISSDSTRTRETWELMAPVFDEEPEVTWDHSLYLAGVDEVYQALLTVPDEVSTVLVLGHNPGWESLVGYFAGEYHEMTTANAALLVGEGERWSDALGANAFDLEDLIRPKEL